MKKFGILYICTGKYDVFRKGFYDSCERNLLVNSDFEKHYFVWTDSDEIKGNNNVTVIKQKNLGWPDNTLKRFHLFLEKRDILLKMDYLFFFNANLEIKQKIGEEILPPPQCSSGGLTVVKHPYFYNKSVSKFTYDRNPSSKAYIRKGEGSYYFAGGLNGGTSFSFLNMCSVLAKNIDIDRENGIVALWHDESHLNRYIFDLEMNGLSDCYNILPPSYLYPEGFPFSFPCKILVRDKTRYINVDNIKGRNGIQIIIGKMNSFIRMCGNIARKLGLKNS